TKLAFEESLKILSQVHGFEHVILRPHNVYGPRQNMRDPYRNVVTIFMNALLKGEPLYVYGDGSQVRCFSYIDDVVTALVRSATLKNVNHIFNVGSDVPYTVKELAALIMKVSRLKSDVIMLPERPREVKTAVSDHSMAKSILKYRDTTSLRSGLKKTWQWAAALGPQQPVFTPIEIESPDLPVNWRK
ncbi:MAG TPA: NAD-dependent epimerase/dehydratase family protein, partial [Patescibacteria group bacterium]